MLNEIVRDYAGPCHTAVVADYCDVGWCIELCCVYDDQLKKNEKFTAYAVLVGQRIASKINDKVKVTWGKWGARLELNKHRGWTKNSLMLMAHQIVKHPSWLGLTLSTHVFTF